MKITMQKVSLFFCILVGLSSPNSAAAYCKLHNVSYKNADETGTCNSHNLTNITENSLSVKKTKQSHQPNVLLIGVETLRADHVGCLGYRRNTTPTLDKLAKEGAVFSRAIATSSWTKPAVMSVFTSLYPAIHKVTDFHKKLSEKINTLAEMLKENGYITAAFVCSPNLDSCYGFSRGFNLYDDFSVQLSLLFNLFGYNNIAVQDIYNEAVTNETVNRVALRWLQENHDKPFFMFVFYFDPHHDYIPPPPFDTVFDPNYKGSIDGRGIIHQPRKSTPPSQRDLDHIIALYDGEILYTDRCISDLLEKFRQYGILDKTLVIVFGDHGDEFYEHGTTGHGHTLYNELIHIPLILRWPEEIPQNKRINTLVSQVDIMPTILDYLDIKYNRLMQGRNLRCLIEGKKDRLHDVVYAEVSRHSDKVFTSAISNQNKCILDLNTGNKQFFDLSTDPSEQKNIYNMRSSNGPVALASCVTQWLANNARLASQLCNDVNLQEVELDEDRLKRLKSLGYLR